MFLPENSDIYTAPLDESSTEACRKTHCGVKRAGVYLDRTLPSLLDEGCEFIQEVYANRASSPAKRHLSRKKAPLATISHYNNGKWQRWTLLELKHIAEKIALGLQQYSAIEKGDRAALFMDSNVPFVMADIGCLLAQIVTVPISPEQPISVTEYMLKDIEANVIFVSHLAQINQLLPILSGLPQLKLIVLASSTDNAHAHNALPKSLKDLQWSLPESVELTTLDFLREKGDWSQQKVNQLRAALSPQDLATIVYTIGDDGLPLGAMLTHENLSGSALAAFNTLPCLRKGPEEVALSFLPLHHIFARGFVYGSLSYGQSLYFSTPRRVVKHLRELKPTVFFTVPRLLEKVYEGWRSATTAENTAQTRLAVKLKRSALAWAWQLAESYQSERAQSADYRLQLWIARQTVLRPLRDLFGGRLQCFISGGAPLPAEVMRLMLAAGLKLCQGYGLTEASSTLSFTRRYWSQVGTVGVPMPGVELALAPDGEVMVKAPYVMQGYYRNAAATRAVLEENGWLHTGDRGKFSPDGLLTITGTKKALFKLSIGEYVAPEPIEQALQKSPLVQRALVVGPGKKFCGLLIFPDTAALSTHAKQLGIEITHAPLEKQPQIVALYQSIVDSVNLSLSVLSTVKRFQLVDVRQVASSDEQLSIASLERATLYSMFEQSIETLYNPGREQTTDVPVSIVQSVSQAIYQLSMLIPSVLSLKKERPNHV